MTARVAFIHESPNQYVLVRIRTYHEPVPSGTIRGTITGWLGCAIHGNTHWEGRISGLQGRLVLKTVTGGGKTPQFPSNSQSRARKWGPPGGVFPGTPGRSPISRTIWWYAPFYIRLVWYIHGVRIAELDIRMSNKTDIRINTYRESLQP
jgi:hypothetical protein